MSWLLDTHALIWALFEPAKLGRKTRDILKDSANDVRVSPLSYWEISLKFGLGKLVLPGTDPSDIPAAALQLGLREDPLDSKILASFHLLPYAPDHRDPFDRLLVWHAIRSKHTLLSRDRALPFFKAHGLKSEW
ncbi:MAG: type II toxin-antitoxin system VapC family toxin [Gloeobacteraceae cyanobacterium ES-bin-144]|nr:type II toxin-antitoxin system VapC family toxin [Verrucomicrobiales bacterium]